MLFVKTLIMIMYFFALFTYVRSRKRIYTLNKRSKMDFFYVLYSTGVMFYVLNLHLIAIVMYFFAMIYYLMGYYNSDFFYYWFNWQKTQKISMFKKINILLSLQIDVDFEHYVYRERLKRLKQEFNLYTNDKENKKGD